MEIKFMAIRKPTNHNYNDGSVVVPNIQQSRRLTPQKLKEKREKGICYSCDRKHTKGHKCVEKKLIYIDFEEEEEKEQKPQKKTIYTRNKPNRKRK